MFITMQNRVRILTNVSKQISTFINNLIKRYNTDFRMFGKDLA